MLMCIQNLVKICPLVLKILSGNEILTLIKGHNSVEKFAKFDIFQSQPRSYQFLCIQNLDKLCPSVLKILSGNEMVTDLRNNRKLE